MGKKKDLPRSIKKVLVTGGGGFVGKAIVKRLTALDVDVRVIGRNSYPELDELGVRCFVGNICDKEIMDKATAGVDTVFHSTTCGVYPNACYGGFDPFCGVEAD